jgi:16S rRNA (guanine527-N7)-methyltransferase
VSELSSSERADLVARLADATVACWSAIEAQGGTQRRPELTPGFVTALFAYLERLLLWRTKTSLVSTDSPVEIVVRHIADSLALAPLVPAGARVADIGSGAGLPGLPLAIVCPDAQLVLVEPRRKRANFLRDATRAAGVANVLVAEARVEELRPAESDSFDLIVSRAFGPLEGFLDAVQPLAGRGSPHCRIIAMKGPRGEEEAAGLVDRHGSPELVRYDLPGRDARVLLVYAAGRGE